MPDLMNLHPVMAERLEVLKGAIRDLGGTYVITSGYRTKQAQQRLWERYRAGLAHFPAAPPGCSWHEYGLAVDLVIEGVDQDIFPDLADAIGLAWSSRDSVHWDVVGQPAC